jgi:hypothetical protein
MRPDSGRRKWQTDDVGAVLNVDDAKARRGELLDAVATNRLQIAAPGACAAFAEPIGQAGSKKRPNGRFL